MAGQSDEIPAVELISALARLDLEAALAYESAAAMAGDDQDLADNLHAFARDHRTHLEALNETLESEGEGPVGPDAGVSGAVLAGLLGVTGPLGTDVVVVTLLGNEQLTNLAYDAALSYDWDDETGAMLRRFQHDEERHVAWLAEKHERLGGTTREPPGPPPASA
jgi:rubrerythrin